MARSSPSSLVSLRSDGLYWRVVDGEVLALDAQTQEYLTTNESGALVWDLLARGTSRAELADRLAQEYGLPSDRAAADVDLMLADLSARGLLVEGQG